MCHSCVCYQNGRQPVGECSHHGYLVVASYDGPRCFFKVSSIGAASAPARSEARTDALPAPGFSLFSNPRKNDLRRGSTADQSGLPDSLI